MGCRKVVYERPSLQKFLFSLAFPGVCVMINKLATPTSKYLKLIFDFSALMKQHKLTKLNTKKISLKKQNLSKYLPSVFVPTRKQIHQTHFITFH